MGPLKYHQLPPVAAPAVPPRSPTSSEAWWAAAREMVQEPQLGLAGGTQPLRRAAVPGPGAGGERQDSGMPDGISAAHVGRR